MQVCKSNPVSPIFQSRFLWRPLIFSPRKLNLFARDPPMHKVHSSPTPLVFPITDALWLLNESNTHHSSSHKVSEAGRARGWGKRGNFGEWPKHPDGKKFQIRKGPKHGQERERHPGPDKKR